MPPHAAALRPLQRWHSTSQGRQSFRFRGCTSTPLDRSGARCRVLHAPDRPGMTGYVRREYSGRQAALTPGDSRCVLAPASGQCMAAEGSEAGGGGAPPSPGSGRLLVPPGGAPPLRAAPGLTGCAGPGPICGGPDAGLPSSSVVGQLGGCYRRRTFKTGRFFLPHFTKKPGSAQTSVNLGFSWGLGISPSPLAQLIHWGRRHFVQAVSSALKDFSEFPRSVKRVRAQVNFLVPPLPP